MYDWQVAVSKCSVVWRKRGFSDLQPPCLHDKATDDATEAGKGTTGTEDTIVAVVLREAIEGVDTGIVDGKGTVVLGVHQGKGNGEVRYELRRIMVRAHVFQTDGTTIEKTTGVTTTEERKGTMEDGAIEMIMTAVTRGIGTGIKDGTIVAKTVLVNWSQGQRKSELWREI